MHIRGNYAQTKRVKAKVRKNGVPRITCPECGAGTRIATAGEVYKGPVPGHIRELLVCERYPACDNYVAINRKYRRYGLPACREVRRLRFIAHRLQDRIVNSGLCTRDEIYSRMRHSYHLPRSKAHLRYFGEALCKAVIKDYQDILEDQKNGKHG